MSCLGLVWNFFFYHSSLITQFPSLVTHHSSLKIPHPVCHYHSLFITQYFSTVCGPHTWHLVKAKLFCGPYHFLFFHFPSFTPLILSKHKPEPGFNNNNNKPKPSFNHKNKNSSNNNNSSNSNNNKTSPNLASTTITKTATKCSQSNG